jgi:cytochrome P450
MPYTEATIMEVMRFSAMVPTGVFHTALEDVKFHGYTIPKQTIIVSNLYACMRDPKVWGDPDNFRPERFLSEDGKTVIRHEALIPFSTGRRVCLGESLAKDELFLFTSSLFQRFRVTPNPEGPKISPLEYISAAVLLPKPHDVIVYDRYETD